MFVLALSLLPTKACLGIACLIPSWQSGHRFGNCQGKKKRHKHKQIWAIVPGVGDECLFMCVFGSFLMEEKSTQTKSQDNPTEIMFMP